MAQWDFANDRDYDAAVCSQFLDVLPVTGAAVSVFGSSLPEACVCATDPLAAKLDEMQFDLGEGPRWQAVSTRLPVFLPDVRNSSHAQWPVYGQALQGTEVRSIFVFPLVVGALDVGVVELYSHSPDPLNRADQDVALALADRAAWSLLDRILTMNERHLRSPNESFPLSRREIHQATGMVLVQLGLTATEALMRMRAHAFAHDQSVRDVAREVVTRTLVFSP